jgi:hypothetical protein
LIKSIWALGNKTPREFLKFLERRGADTGSVEMELKTKSYLEANPGKVKGYLVMV